MADKKVTITTTKENKHHKVGSVLSVTPEISKILVDKGYATEGGEAPQEVKAKKGKNKEK